jgi:hypothetical protein
MTQEISQQLAKSDEETEILNHKVNYHLNF